MAQNVKSIIFTNFYTTFKIINLTIIKWQYSNKLKVKYK